ncbi:CbtA family protein [Ferrovibrio sp.]|uniref:CbtA family protein n=1 Tax=Ferrovibrio sp. TaxID=1917215 RepID=UPI00311F5BBC
MPFRLGAAAMMAAILSTLAVMIARAVIDPPITPDIPGREAFLFQHLILAAMAAVILQILLLWQGRADYRTGLVWGAGGFAAAVVAPWLALPHLPVGELPMHDPAALLFWLLTVVVSAIGLWLLLRGGFPLRPAAPGGLQARLGGVVLLLLPLLLVPVPDWAGADWAGPEMPPAAHDASGDPLDGLEDDGAAVMLVVNLLFWLALGLASVLAARQIVHRPAS